MHCPARPNWFSLTRTYGLKARGFRQTENHVDRSSCRKIRMFSAGSTRRQPLDARGVPAPSRPSGRRSSRKNSGVFKVRLCGHWADQFDGGTRGPSRRAPADRASEGAAGALRSAGRFSPRRASWRKSDPGVPRKRVIPLKRNRSALWVG